MIFLRHWWLPSRPLPKWWYLHWRCQYIYLYVHSGIWWNQLTGLLPGHLFSSGEMAGGRSKISSALNRLALEIPLDLYCVVFTNIIEHTWEWVQLPIINTLCQYRLTFQSVIFKIYSITRNSPTLKLKLSFGTNFLSNFLKGTTR